MMNDKEANVLFDKLNEISREYNKLMKPILKLQNKFDKIATKLSDEGYVVEDIGTIQ